MNLDLDNITVKVACRVDNTCQATPNFRFTEVRLSEDFEGLDPIDPTALVPSGNLAPAPPDTETDWVFFGAVYDSTGTLKFPYGPFAAPNATASPSDTFISAVVTGEGGAEQGVNQLSIFSDYNCCFPDDGHVNGTDLVEISVFREFTIGCDVPLPDIFDPESCPAPNDDIGSIYSFSFDAKRGNIAGDTTALAFIATIDPNAGFNRTNFVTLDTTDLPDSWLRYTIEFPIADPELEGQLIQFGFQNTAGDFESSSNYYDNVVVVRSR